MVTLLSRLLGRAVPVLRVAERLDERLDPSVALNRKAG
jgi:hypothetical protein